MSVISIFVLISINVVVYFATVANGQLIYDLGLQTAVWTERPWTLVTNLFVHGGLWHLFANMITLFFFGTYLSSLIKGARFWLVYFIGGIVGNLFFVLLGPENAIAVGASGAVFAVAGSLTVLRPNLKVYIFPIPAPIPLWVAIAGSFVILSFLPNVAWQAHLGGFIVGAVAGAFFRRRPYKRSRLPW